MTPSALMSSGDWIGGTQTRFHRGASPMFGVDGRLDEDLIARLLGRIDGEGGL